MAFVCIIAGLGYLFFFRKKEKEEVPPIPTVPDHSLVDLFDEEEHPDISASAEPPDFVNADDTPETFAVILQPTDTNAALKDSTSSLIQSVSPETEDIFSSQAPVKIDSPDNRDPEIYQEEVPTDEDTQEDETSSDESTVSAKKMSLRIGPEWNMNARENFAAGAVIGFDYGFLGMFAAGLSLTASSNFNGITVLEPAAAFRWYFLPRNKGTYSGFFVQADIGAYLVFEDGGPSTLFDGGLRAGFRLPLGKMFYIEPYGRVGYPFVFGLGAAAGIRF